MKILQFSNKKAEILRFCQYCQLDETSLKPINIFAFLRIPLRNNQGSKLFNVSYVIDIDIIKDVNWLAFPF